MSEHGEPYVPASESPLELTVRVVVVGILLGILMTAANAYLGLYAGMTVSASIPAAVMSMIILRSIFKDVTILENNAVQTMASAGESLAAGIIFTVPALLVIPNLWDDIQILETTIIALLGGLMGTMFTIALRRLFIVEEALPYPEGVACREVLVAGEEGGEGSQAILYALGIGAIYGLMVKGFEATHHTVEGVANFLGTKIYAGIDLSVALLSVGYIVGIRIASFIFLGGVIGFGVLVPLYGLVNGWGPGEPAEQFKGIWATQIRYAGVGAMVVGGLYTLWSMRKSIITGISKALKPSTTEDENLLRTEIDLPMRFVLLFCGVIVILTILFYWWKTGSIILALAGGVFLAITAFFFAAVAGYIAGVVGSSNSPVSGMTIATLLFTVALVWVVGDLLLDLSTPTLMLATMLIASIVASSAAIAGDVMQDLKTGHMVGATPRVQQIAEIIGVITGALVIGPTLKLLHNAFGITKTACLREAVNDPSRDCSNALTAPQAELIGDIVRGSFVGDVNMQMIVLGVVIAIVLIWLKMPVMSVAIGIYLPLGLSVPIMLGGILSYFAFKSAHIRIDGEIREEPSKEAIAAAKDVENRGVLIGAGFIAGESILGVFVALLIVLEFDLAKIFHTGTLNNFFSLIFFGWFVLVFIWLATRSLPRNGNLLKEFGLVLKDSFRKIVRMFIPSK